MAPAPASEIAAALRSITRCLEAEALANDGRGVGYASLAASPTYAALVDTSRSLRALHLPELARDPSAQAFWINLYNVLVIHGVVALGIRRSVMEVPSFFGTVAYRVGDLLFTPDEIENGILRANARHPATGLRPFASGDPRLDFAMPAADPRIHAALVCAAKACPPIAFYDGDRIDEQLALAARTFVTHDTEVDERARAVRLSILYRYYADDFGGEPGVRRFLLAHAEGTLHSALERALHHRFTLAHRRYDWTLNAIA